MAVLKNRAKMSTSTTGTGSPITLGSAESGYQSFADAGVANADVVRYVIEDTGGAFEIGTGTYTSSGTTLSRTVSESSNSNNAINLSGSATVFIGATAEDILSDVVDDTTPQLGGNLDVQTREITTSTTNGNVKLTPNGTGVVEVKGAGGNDGTLQLNCSANSHGVKIKSPPHSAAASYTLTLPDDDGAASEFLQTDGSGNLSWAAAGGGGDPDLYRDNASSATTPVASGTNAVAIGDSAVASGVDAAAIGNLATATGYRAFAGPKSRAGGQESVALGIGSTNTSYGAPQNFSQAIGLQAYASTAETTAIGNYAVSSGTRSVALAKSYASGTDSLAAAIANNTSTYGAQGSYSVAIGRQQKTTGSYSSTVGGYNNNATATYSAVAGGSNNSAMGRNSFVTGATNAARGMYSSIIGGESNDTQTTAKYSVASGQYANAKRIGQKVHASGRFSTDGDAQGSTFILRADTTDATATVLTANNSAASTDNQIVADSDTCITFDGTITAMQNGAQAYASWKIEGLLVNDGGTTTLANSATTVIQNLSSWGMALSADNTNNALAITCTGEAAHNIRWVANIRTTEVTYA